MTKTAPDNIPKCDCHSDISDAISGHMSLVMNLLQKTKIPQGEYEDVHSDAVEQLWRGLCEYDASKGMRTIEAYLWSTIGHRIADGIRSRSGIRSNYTEDTKKKKLEIRFPQHLDSLEPTELDTLMGSQRSAEWTGEEVPLQLILLAKHIDSDLPVILWHVALDYTKEEIQRETGIKGVSTKLRALREYVALFPDLEVRPEYSWTGRRWKSADADLPVKSSKGDGR